MMRLKNISDFRKIKMLLLICLGISFLFIQSCNYNLDPLIFPEKEVVFKELIITANNGELDKIKDFWENTMGCEIINKPNSIFSVKIGTSLLSYRQNLSSLNRPQYHFAILIPSNQIEKCLAWLKNGGIKKNGEEVKLWKDGVDNAEIIQKPTYNSTSIYFDDSGGNIIELVSRRNLQNEEEGDFSPTMLKEINSVSITTLDIRGSQELIEDNFGYRPVPKTTTGFRVMGNENGMINLVIQNRVLPPTNSEQAFPYVMDVIVQNAEPKQINIPSYFINVISEP